MIQEEFLEKVLGRKVCKKWIFFSKARVSVRVRVRVRVSFSRLLNDHF